MAFEVKRAAELTVISLLNDALPGLDFYPSKGGDDTGGVTLPTPPFGVVWINSSEKTLAQEETWIMRGTVVWVTRADITDVADHSDSFKRIYDVLAALDNNQGKVDVGHRLVIHGIDVDSTDEFFDAERQAHGDIINFALGVSERGKVIAVELSSAISFAGDVG